jgi:6-pyruvoyltetrahydropterin/6-carboxytetrahydropterin synthase
MWARILFLRAWPQLPESAMRQIAVEQANARKDRPMGYFIISKMFQISSSHHLDRLPAEHKCSRDHGHNYDITVFLRASEHEVLHVSDYGWVRDYGDLSAFKNFLDTTLDHRDLNDVLTPEFTGIPNFTPTAELLAYWLFKWCRMHWLETCAVEVKETDKTCARYEA